MADADLDVVIRQLARQLQTGLMTRAKERRDRFSGLAAKAKGKETCARFKMMAKATMEQATAAAKTPPDVRRQRRRQLRPRHAAGRQHACRDEGGEAGEGEAGEEGREGEEGQSQEGEVAPRRATLSRKGRGEAISPPRR